MLRVLMSVVLALTLAAPLRAQSTEAEVQGVIRQQLDAFRADDFEGAFTFASRGIRRLFGTPERFAAMVKQGYPMVWRPGDVRFLGQQPRGAGVRQKVLITDRAGLAHVLEYSMMRGEDGWRIDGVRILDGPQLGV